jgi:hypothetical protein
MKHTDLQIEINDLDIMVKYQQGTIKNNYLVFFYNDFSKKVAKTAKIEELKTFLKTSIAVFEFHEKMKSILSSKLPDRKLYNLHQAALLELEKQDFDPKVINTLFLKIKNI